MRIVLVLVLIILGQFTHSSGAGAQEPQMLFRNFNAQALSLADKRFLQTALAFEGHYHGMLDGDWGRLSQQAMSRYSRSTFKSETENWHMAMLALSFWERLERNGWRIRYMPSMGVSLLWPERSIVTDPPSTQFLNFRHATSSLSISMGIQDDTAAQRIHDYTSGTHGLASAPYTVRKPGFAVTSATKRDGSTLYTRSNKVNGRWSTIMLHASKTDGPVLNAVSASIAVGAAPAISFSPGGVLDDAIVKTVAILSEPDVAPNRRADTTSSPKEPETSGGSSAGSGFVVSSDGHVLTNAHVVAGCAEVRVDGELAILEDVSEGFDLALLKTQKPAGRTVAVFSATSAKLNSDVTAVGFPYAGLLGGLNVTRGSVSSLKGLGGDATRLQMTAPVQSGNSGGPLLATDGEVVGVVVAKLNAQKVADLMGDTPQNVNFAVRGEIAKLFLSQNGVEPQLSLADDPMAPEALASLAEGFTTFIECR